MLRIYFLSRFRFPASHFSSSMNSHSFPRQKTGAGIFAGALIFRAKIKMNKRFILAIVLLWKLSAGHAQEEMNWVRQHPLSPLVQLEDVEMDPSGLGLAVGDNGTIFRTTDFGASWEAVETDFSFTVFEVAIVPGSGGEQAWAGLAASTRVAKTTDGGLTWQVVETGYSLSAAVYLAAPDANTLYVGTQAGVLKTADQGQNWEEVTPAPGLNWSSISFSDASTGWAATTSGAIYRTTDGGATWEEPAPGQFDGRVQLHFQDAGKGYAAVFRSFFRTTDGGESWELLSDAAFSTNLEELDIADSSFMVGTVGNTSFTTTDGGFTWERVMPLSYSYRNQGICALPDGRVWIAGSHTMAAYSVDFGMTYSDQVPGNKNTITSLAFTDMQHGWATGMNGTVLRTSAAGSSWEEASLPDGGQVSAGIAFSPEEFWACNGNQLVYTTDGGQSWAAFEGVVAGNSTYTDMVAVKGAVFASNYNGKVYRTTDNGASWEELPTMHNGFLFGLSFPTPEVGYAVGQDSTVLKTADGGDSWERLDIPTSYNLDKAYFFDADNGWVAAAANIPEIFRTEDGGNSWEVVSLPFSGFWKEAYFSSPSTGYIVGGTASVGRVLRTTDGGDTWEAIYTTYGLLNAIARQEDETGARIWIGGFGGNIELWEDVQVSTRQLFRASRLHVFPNPAREALHLQLPPGLPVDAHLVVYDGQGRPRMRLPARPRLELGRRLEAGVYLLRLESEGQVWQARVLILD